jgi:hypothetical protein
VVGAAMIIGAIVSGIDALDVLVGLVAFPLAVAAAVVVRGRDARPVRLTGLEGHCLNCALIVAAFVLLPAAALLFYGTSMLVAAARGYEGCELFAFSNLVWHRDDQIACPLFHPIDRAEHRAGSHTGSP